MIGNLVERLSNRGVSVTIQPIANIQISLWRQDALTKKSPIFKGYVYVNGIKHKVVLWKNISDNPNAPQLTGCLDTYQPTTTTTQA
jgi:hypothetical protein